MRSLVIVIVTIVAAATALATATAVPLVYLMGWDVVKEPFFGTTISLVALGFPFALLYGASNFASGISDQDDHGLYWLDHVPSILAWLSITVTACVVMFGLFQANQDIVRVIKETFGLQLLMGLVAFSWFDVFVLQRKKHRMLKQQLTDPNAPATPQLAQQPQTNSTGPTIIGAVLAMLLLAALIGGTLYASRYEGEGGCRETYVGTVNGTRMYETDCKS